MDPLRVDWEVEYDILVLIDNILSRVSSEKPSLLVLSLLAGYGHHRGGELPGTWFVAVLERLGFQPSAVRQTLYRMRKEGYLEERRHGAHKLYRMSSYADTATQAGTTRLLQPPETEWDGQWLLANYRFNTDEVIQRNLVRAILEVEGFGQLSRATLLHPRDRSAAVLGPLTEAGLAERVTMIRGRVTHGRSDAELVRAVWDLEQIARGYRAFIRTFSPLTRYQWSRRDPWQALAARFTFVLRYLETAWRDPSLPLELLPASWPAARAQEVAAALYQSLKGPLLDLGDRVLEQIGLRHVLVE